MEGRAANLFLGIDTPEYTIMHQSACYLLAKRVKKEQQR